MPGIGLIILAAGSSSRLGRPKQSVDFQGKTLLRHAAETALRSQASAIMVVLGANHRQFQTELHDLPVDMLVNERWSEGVGSSIRCGVEYAIEQENFDSLIVMACDQPMVSADLLNFMIDTRRRIGASIVACRYGESLGTPCLFARKHFKELCALQGSEGEKNIILEYAAETAAVCFEDGELDVDTAADVQKLARFG